MELPAGIVDPLFEHELALRLGMTVRELGERMDLHEMTVRWPLYFDYERRQAEAEANK